MPPSAKLVQTKTKTKQNELQMESNAFGSSHLPSQALVVLSEAASGLHEALRGQRPFPSRVSKIGTGKSGPQTTADWNRRPIGWRGHIYDKS